MRAEFRISRFDEAPFLGPITALRPDETLYSWVARIGRALGLADVWAVREFLHGGTKARFYPDLATGLEAFVLRSGQTRWKVEQLALATTTYGYFANFLPRDDKRSLLTNMAHVGTFPHHKTGLAHGTFEVSVMRFCAQCHEVMDDLAGERWWRRSLQIPTTRRCPEHHCTLQESSVDNSAMNQALLLPDQINCPPGAACIGDTRDDIRNEILTAMARFGQVYLDAGVVFGPRKWEAFYRKAILARRISYRCDKDLVRDLSEDLGPSVAALQEGDFLPFLRSDGDKWLERVVLGRHYAPPMEHILFQACLDVLYGSPLAGRAWKFDPDTCRLLTQTRGILQFLSA